MTRTAQHRPATRRRRFRHDDPLAVDLFSGFGGLTEGIRRAGFTTIMAANHNQYKIEVHEANHPYAEHWIADLVDPDSSDYHSARDLPAADLLVAGVSCVNHSQANTQKAYLQRLSLFDLEDPDFEERVTRSERDRATANCVLHYAAQHLPRLILVECTTELSSWGPAIPGKPKVGDGTTYRWWLNEFGKLGYKHRVLYLNSMFFGVPQSRDRLYIVFWDQSVPTPDLDHCPASWCHHCDTTVEAVWTWKTGIPPTGSVRYGKQYIYHCPSCRREITPPRTPSLDALDLTDLGTPIGDRKRPLAASTMARAERARRRFADFPAVIMPAKALHGSERHPWQPLATQTSQQEAALLSTGALMQMANGYEHPALGGKGVCNAALSPLEVRHGQREGGGEQSGRVGGGSQCRTRDLTEPLWTQPGSETLALISAAVMPFRRRTVPKTHAEPMATVTAEQIPGLLSAAWFKQNGGPTDTATPPLSDPLGTITSADTTGLLTAHWRQTLADIALEDCYFRMLREHEVGRGCGFDVPFGDHPGTFVVWGSARAQVDGYGNAVSPAVGHWIGDRLRAALHRMETA